MFGVQKTSKPQSSESSGANSLKARPDGRERLRHFSDEMSKASNAIEDLEQRVARLGSIIVEADSAARALQECISNDGGVALSKYSSGQCKPGEEISKLVALAKSSGEAAEAAKIALPTVESSLVSAREQLVSLGGEKNAELHRVIAMLADEDARAYERSFRKTCEIHDRLVGFARVESSNIGDVHLILEPPRIARFALLGNQDADPFLRHRESEITVAQSARRWSAIRSRLEADVDADISDLN